jgi:hypothetical protein
MQRKRYSPEFKQQIIKEVNEVGNGSLDAGTQTVAVSTSVYSISMVIGSTLLTVNGKTEMMDQTSVIKNGRAYLPARWVANALGYQVDWNAQSQNILIWPNGTQEPPFGLTGLRA